jgi:hypothetical protein
VPRLAPRECDVEYRGRSPVLALALSLSSSYFGERLECLTNSMSIRSLLLVLDNERQVQGVPRCKAPATLTAAAWSWCLSRVNQMRDTFPIQSNTLGDRFSHDVSMAILGFAKTQCILIAA